MQHASDTARIYYLQHSSCHQCQERTSGRSSRSYLLQRKAVGRWRVASSLMLMAIYQQDRIIATDKSKDARIIPDIQGT